MTADPLAQFGPATRHWFESAFDSPTASQGIAWQAINDGQHALVIAPTGSGKTLAAFLSAIDHLAHPAPTGAEDDTPAGPRVLYISPLKALAVDVERNLRAPLRGIGLSAEKLGVTLPEIRVGLRSGDTSPADRRRLTTKPPDILITTPESLFLMMTSQAREVLRAVDTVIVDEVHVLAGTKRGAHLALTLERLESAAHNKIQRIGLSATVSPAERVADFLGGGRPVSIVAPAAPKQWELEINVPVEDMTSLAVTTGATEDGPGQTISRSIWPHVEQKVLDLVEANRSTIVFCNSRRSAERVTAHLNELHAERLGVELDQDQSPAAMMAQSPATKAIGDAPVVARAHHGSVSKEQRALIEHDLKAGQLPCVVATSSLELGIDMGAVDVVVQLESPPSVASGLQRVGRAGHHVGASSHGAFFPNHRGDLVETTVIVDRMRLGQIEDVAELRNPLDVLAQQVVAITVAGPITVDDLFALVRRAANFADLSRNVFNAVLDMLSGRYPSEEFAELRPRLVWDRSTDVLTARPGAQRLATTSGGTIPDRGLFGVFLVGDDKARRVGELDEEMVYESRVGDVFTLGTTSWRIENITHDQVQVSPAPGQAGKLPFWTGDTQGRPIELGRAIGAFVRTLATDSDRSMSLAGKGLNAYAANNLSSYLDDQLAATGVLPTDRTLVFERFRDELGDWRICLHSTLGTPVLSPWAMAIQRRARLLHGAEAQATATNDGIVIRVPDTDAGPPSIDLVTFDPEEIEQLVTDEVGGSALFASRFRECASRALLLPRRDPRARAALWQQRMRSAQLLSVAGGYPDFPIVLETMRECLQDVFDLPALVEIHRHLQARQLRMVEVETKEASPFARTLLFGYVGEFIYNGDTPAAERKAAALTLDPGLLAELLGSDAVQQFLDSEVVAQTEAELQSLAEDRRAGNVEQLFDLLRQAGPFSHDELSDRYRGEDLRADLATLQSTRRIAVVRISRVDRFAAAEDVWRFHEGLGLPAPPGFAITPGDSDPLEDLVLRWARTHGPFHAQTLASRYGLGVSVVRRILTALADAGTVTSGHFLADEGSPEGLQHCHHRVLSLVKRRTLARLRAAVEPVDAQAYGRFLPGWQQIGTEGAETLTGVDGVLNAIDQLAGCPIPASMLESVVLPCRVPGYTPAMLDELLLAGEVEWAGDGTLGDNDGWIRLAPQGFGLMRTSDPVSPASPAASALVARLGDGGGWLFDELVTSPLEGNDELPRSAWVQALWELVWAGQVRCDTFAPVRARVSQGALRSPRRPSPRSRAGMLRSSRVKSRLPRDATTSGRWSAVRSQTPDPVEALLVLLDRHGVLTRGSVVAEGLNFAEVYRGLSKLEDAGHCLRGYFIDGLGAAQFSTSATVDRLRDQPVTGTLVLAAVDPANPYGAALPWPPLSQLPGSEEPVTHRPGRKGGALVILVDGELVFYVERGGKSLLVFTSDLALLAEGARGLASTVTRGWLGQVRIERANSRHVFDAPNISGALQGAGFAMTPQGLRLRG